MQVLTCNDHVFVFELFIMYHYVDSNFSQVCFTPARSACFLMTLSYLYLYSLALCWSLLFRETPHDVAMYQLFYFMSTSTHRCRPILRLKVPQLIGQRRIDFVVRCADFGQNSSYSLVLFCCTTKKK